jgi:HNH endonuclease
MSHHYGPKLRDRLTREELHRLYHEERLSQAQIAARFGVTPGAIHWRMCRWGIPARDMTEARIEAARTRFSGPNNPRWKGGRTHVNGYVLVQAPDHPRVDHRGYVREHILVWEEAHGTLLPDGWHVHHKNGVKDDNRPENLEAMTHGEHRDVIPSLLRRIAALEAEIEELKSEQ